MGETDKDLWRKFAAGDADAFGVLFDRHADAVFRYCLSRCGSWHDAEELVSITFLEAWRQRNRLRPERDTVLPWLLGVATNANRNRARAARRHADFLARLPHSDPRHGEHEADHAESVALRLDAERAVRELLDTTAGLNDGERDVVILCLMNGIGQEEAAKTLGVRTGTVKSRLHRARAKLAKMNGAPEPVEQLDTKIVEARLS
ncbi:RNA polymerase sigma factor [Arthrobacter sp. FW306-2-2C-D06B]|uniref:RNA polymerase sigma factor n=1 Tax=Arthrobacter sp. FW306-2-2C-D06B TaxID=2879618 RepID=UPI001F16FF09|nr:sigma-70 family RNA polymerase sigma factor [Arthrobacter sp. FW306-2-2C-D06B]UKA56934.1 sigma-70 family RNA polymerase sigma factor [Arthrobacter sp. FW306-2-2C-D06B]